MNSNAYPKSTPTSVHCHSQLAESTQQSAPYHVTANDQAHSPLQPEMALPSSATISTRTNPWGLEPLRNNPTTPTVPTRCPAYQHLTERHRLRHPSNQRHGYTNYGGMRPPHTQAERKMLAHPHIQLRNHISSQIETIHH